MSVIARCFLPLFVFAGCTASAPEAKSPAEKPEPEAASGPVSEALRAKVCATDETDETSMIYLGRDENGVVTRLSVTPMESLADAGGSIFDMEGNLLGHGTGGEIPWEDEAFVAQERARVAALMGGATITEGQTPLSCKPGAGG